MRDGKPEKNSFYSRYSNKTKYEKRRCLRCDEIFPSVSKFNRTCVSCKGKGGEQEEENKVSLQTR